MGESRRARIEETQNERGPATREREWGCPLCRWEVVNRNTLLQQTRLRKQAAESSGANMGRRREDKRLRQKWVETDYDEEQEVASNTACTSRHTLVEECAGAQATERRILGGAVTELHKIVTKMHKKQGGGEDVLEVINQARDAVQAENRKEPVTDGMWSGLNKVLAGILPDWRPNSQGKKASDGLAPCALVTSIRCAQKAASRQVENQLKETKLVRDHLQKSETLRIKMSYVLRAWRAEVEHSAENVHDQPAKWRVRREGDRQRPSTQAATTTSIENKKMTRQTTGKELNNKKPTMRDEQQPEELQETLQRINAVLTCLRVSSTRATTITDKQKARASWKTLRENLACAVEKYRKDTTKGEAARNTGTNARTSRATAKGNTPDYKQTRPWTKKTTGPEKLIKKRRERTTKATKNGMELQKWMQTVGEENTELRRPKGIG